MQAQELRHRIAVQSKAETRDPSTGYPTQTWADRLTDEPAQWLAGPGREYLAGEALRAAVTGRFVIRWSAAAAAISAGDRVVWDGRNMEVKAPPLVDETARKWITLMVAEDGTDGA